MLVRYLRSFPQPAGHPRTTAASESSRRGFGAGRAHACSLGGTPRYEGRIAQLDAVVDLAQYPNLALKWCHAPARLSGEPYPHRDVLPHLRRVIDAYGVEHVMWASDYTQSRHTFGRPWAEAVPISWIRPRSPTPKRSGSSGAACARR